MRRILMLATGGTIASKDCGHGLSPTLTSEELLRHVPGIGSFCTVDTLQLMNLDSTNIGPTHWLEISAAIEAQYDKYDGFVITHGTDTMAYTSAALSYLIQNSPKPIVITGAQKSIAMDETDARRNLYSSFLYAADSDSHDVSLVFDGKVILGTRARKERTKSYNAFSSVDYPEIGMIRDGKLIRYLGVKQYIYGAQPQFYHQLEPDILLLTLIPGMGAQALRQLKEHYRAVICQSFGVGGLPGGGESEFSHAVGEWLDSGKTFVIMTQVPYEGSDMSVYQVGQQVKERYQVIEAYNMTMEAVVTKLMWVLGQTSEPEEIQRMFYQPVQCDLIR
ncbi:MAG: asparaginase [Oscillospiraceae bacterium]|nr:asparaginase [Oscillospiraceae bacterium]